MSSEIKSVLTYSRDILPGIICHIKHQTLLTSGISRGTLRTCMPCKTTGLGWSMDRTGAPSWTSVEVKLEDWDCLSRSLQV